MFLYTETLEPDKKMTKLLFSLRGVPEDEAAEVRETLENHNIDFYETNAGNWGISMPGLWVNDESEWFEARKILTVYQENRYKKQRTAYLQLKGEGKHKRLIDMIKQKPALTLFYCSFIIFILYISIKLVFEIGL